MDRKSLHKICLIVGAVFAFVNMLFNKDSVMWLELSGPVIIYLSFFLIRVIRIPQVILEFFMIVSVVLSYFYFYFYTYSIDIALVCLLYYIVILTLHKLRIFPFIQEDQESQIRLCQLIRIAPVDYLKEIIFEQE